MILKRNLIFASVASAFCLSIILLSCNKEEGPTVIYGPGPAPKISEEYDYSRGDDKITNLGRLLFYDRNLSLNNTISCGSCHKQEKAFADNHQFSRGLNNDYSTRNTSAISSSFNHEKFWDGRGVGMDSAVFMPVQNHKEMDMFDLRLLPEKLATYPYYRDLFQAAFPDGITLSNINKALAQFTNNLISRNSKYDQVYGSEGEVLFEKDFFTINPNIKEDEIGDHLLVKPGLTVTEELGRRIFFGKARCYNCHSGQDFNGYSTRYENIGLDDVYEDKGRANITKNKFDDGSFAVPSLRNIGITSPYMHDGRFKTLEEVVNHYNEGIKNTDNLSYSLREIDPSFFRFDPFNHITSLDAPKNFPIRKLNLTEQEKKALVEFLKTLTDPTYISDPKFSNPF